MFISPYKSYHIGLFTIHLWKHPRFDYGNAPGDYWGKTVIWYLHIGYVEFEWLQVL
jgi:hypothetical protein